MADHNSLEINIKAIGIHLNNNISQLMKANCVTLSVLHRNTGIAIPTIKRLQSDPTANPTITTLLPIANFFGISLNQLIGNEPLPSKTEGYIENKAHWLRVPLIKWDQIILWLESENQFQIKETVLVDINLGKNAFALIVEEDDWPTIFPGSILIINAELTPEHKDYAIVSKKGQIIPTLRQVLIDEEKIYLKPLNPHFQPTLFDQSYTFLGVLMQIRKDTKI